MPRPREGSEHDGRRDERRPLVREDGDGQHDRQRRDRERIGHDAATDVAVPSRDECRAEERADPERRKRDAARGHDAAQQGASDEQSGRRGRSRLGPVFKRRHSFADRFARLHRKESGAGEHRPDEQSQWKRAHHLPT